MFRIDGGKTFTKNVTGLAKYTEYVFQVLAFTSVGDGPNTTVESGKTKEDGEKSIILLANLMVTYLHKLLDFPPSW